MSYETAKNNYQMRKNPPQYAPGQAPDNGFGEAEDINDFFADGVDTGFNAFGGNAAGGFADFNASAGGVDNGSLDSFFAPPNSMMAGGPPMMGGMPNQVAPQQGKSTEEIAAQMFTGTTSFVKQIVESKKYLTPRWYAEWGRKTMGLGVVVSVVGLIIRIFGVRIGLQLTIGSLLTVATGVVVWFFNTDKARNYTSLYSDGSDTMVVPTNDINANTDAQMNMSDNLNMNSDEDFGDFENFDNGEEDMLDSEYVDDADDFYSTVDSAPPVDVLNKNLAENVDSVISKVVDGISVADTCIVNRVTLYNLFMKMLPNFTPDFQTFREVPADSDEMIMWQDYMEEACNLIDITNPADYPELLSVKENSSIVLVSCRSLKKANKFDNIGDHIASIYARNLDVTIPDDSELDESDIRDSVSAYVSAKGAIFDIVIFKPDSAIMVSLRDMIKPKEAYMTNESKLMPVLVGMKNDANLEVCNLADCESMVISGQPRSGKSWFTFSVLLQLCAFSSPKDLNMFIIDPKGDGSDFYGFKDLPHVQGFGTSYVDLMQLLNYIVNVEMPMRKEMLKNLSAEHGGGIIKIQDYNAKCAKDAKMPYTYIIVEEFTSISAMAQDDDKDTYNSLISMLKIVLTQAPALGIRCIFITHAMDNKIIPREITNQLTFKIVVKGDNSQLKKMWDKEGEKIKFKLTRRGDLAVQTPDRSGIRYVHAPMITTSNSGNAGVVKVLNAVWNKLEPEFERKNFNFATGNFAKPTLSSNNADKGHISLSKSSPVSLDKSPVSDVDNEAMPIVDSASSFEPDLSSVLGNGKLQGIEMFDDVKDDDNNEFNVDDMFE